jgi:WD40 repeat protein
VRWQAQDVDGARLRDDLRQAARRWDERDRLDDLLWTGTAFREYQLWRERYPGGLTELEGAFATAMTALSTRRRRRRRMAAVAAVAALVAVLAVVTTLWLQAMQATRRAEAAANRAEAARLITLGRITLEQDCTAALAYAIAALERADKAAARRLAVRALWAGPPATVVHGKADSWEVNFSPDGRWLASGNRDGTVLAFSRDGGAPVEVQGPAEDQEYIWWLSFSPDGRLLVGGALGAGGQVRVWETEGWTLQRVLQSPEPVASLPELPGNSLAYGVVEPDRPSLVTVTLAAGGGPWTNPDVTGRWVVRRWPLAGGPSELMGEVPGSFNNIAVVDLSRRLLVAGIGSDLYLHELDRLGEVPGRVVARHPGAIGWFGVAFHPTEPRLAACDTSRTLREWSLEGDGTEPRRELELAGWPWGTTFSPDGRWLALGTEQRSVGAMWDMQGPAFNEPLYVGGRSPASSQAIPFSPDGRWLAGTNTNFGYRRNGVTIWPVDDRYPRVLRLADGVLASKWRYNIYHPDGSRIFTVATGKDGLDTLLSYPLSGGVGVAPTVLFRDNDLWAYTVDPMGRFLVVGSASGVRKLPLSGGPATMLEGLERVDFLSIDPTGRYLASELYEPTGAVLVLDLESGERHVIEPPGESEVGRHSLQFDSAGRLLATRGGVLSRWDPTTRASEVVAGEGVDQAFPLPDGDRLVLWSDEGDGQKFVSVLDLGSGSRTELPRAHQGCIGLHWDPTGSVWVSTHADGEIRVGSLTDEEPHLLLSHETVITFARVSPDGRWILTRGDNSLRLWPMPDVTKKPLHTLPYDELMTRLRALTNVRAIPDPESPNGYVLDPDFTAHRGWAEVPEW